MGNERKTVAVVGGGAAGLAAAAACGDALGAARGAADVVVYEADERVGRSILATGNGRCNFSNARIDAALYRNAPFVAAAFEALAAAESRVGRRGGAGDGDPVHAFFADCGLVWREEAGGRLYPAANKASSVLDVLRAAVAAAGAREACGRRVERIEAPRAAGRRWTLRMADGAFERADAVIVTVGGRVARALLPEGLPYAAPRPVLGPLRTDTRAIRELDNIRVRCAVELRRAAGALCDAGGGLGSLVAREEGEVLFRSYGVSGIAVFNLSRFAQEGDTLLIDLLPQVDAREAQGFLTTRRRRMAARGLASSCGELLRGLLLPQVARAVLRQAGLAASASPGKDALPALAGALKSFPLAVEGIADERQCQVRRGGFSVSAFDPATMQAQGHPGLFAAGEALEVDAPCGGYNLHWAWASGLLAGRAAAACASGALREDPPEDPAASPCDGRGMRKGARHA